MLFKAIGRDKVEKLLIFSYLGISFLWFTDPDSDSDPNPIQLVM